MDNEERVGPVRKVLFWTEVSLAALTCCLASLLGVVWLLTFRLDPYHAGSFLLTVAYLPAAISLVFLQAALGVRSRRAWVVALAHAPILLALFIWGLITLTR